MFVCLCTGVTSQVVTDLVATGAATSKQIADACGAGADCGRCRRTVRAIIGKQAEAAADHLEKRGDGIAGHCRRLGRAVEDRGGDVHRSFSADRVRA